MIPKVHQTAHEILAKSASAIQHGKSIKKDLE